MQKKFRKYLDFFISVDPEKKKAVSDAVPAYTCEQQSGEKTGTLYKRTLDVT